MLGEEKGYKVKYLLAFWLSFVILYSCTDESELISQNTVNINRESEYIYVFGDIQYHTNGVLINNYVNSVNWILHKHSQGYNIKAILQTGDLTNNNKEKQWISFRDNTSELAQTIPYIPAIGDHDYKWYDRVYIDDRNDTHFNEYVGFDKLRSRIVAQFEEGHYENIIVSNEIQGEKVYIITLEFGPRPEVVEWANNYIRLHQDIKFILLNHEYLGAGGGIKTNNPKCKIRIRKSKYLTPEKLWNQLIKVNNNIVCVLCGHVSSLYAITYLENDYGRLVPQIQHNIQVENYRIDYWLMQWEFPRNSDSASVSIVNTKGNYYYADTLSLFKFRYRY